MILSVLKFYARPSFWPGFLLPSSRVPRRIFYRNYFSPRTTRKTRKGKPLQLFVWVVYFAVKLQLVSSRGRKVVSPVHFAPLKNFTR
jgi:hypothetical protein